MQDQPRFGSYALLMLMVSLLATAPRPVPSYWLYSPPPSVWLVCDLIFFVFWFLARPISIAHVTLWMNSENFLGYAFWSILPFTRFLVVLTCLSSFTLILGCAYFPRFRDTCLTKLTDLRQVYYDIKLVENP